MTGSTLAIGRWDVPPPARVSHLPDVSAELIDALLDELEDPAAPASRNPTRDEAS